MSKYCFALLFFILYITENHAIASVFDTNSSQHKVGMRLRYQTVDDIWLNDATAFTMRVNLTSTFLLDEAKQWQFELQPNYVYAFDHGDYNSVTIRKNTSPIPDPQGLNLTSMHLLYDSKNDWQLKLGRQKLTFDNERFISAADFWQTPQNFDALKLAYNDQINWHVQYAYTTKVHRIFGKDSTFNIPKEDIRHESTIRPANELGEHKLNAHIFNIEYKTENNVSLIAYSHLVENKTQALFSTKILGMRITDEFKPNKIKYRYATEFALQKSAYNNPNRYQAWYSLLEASVQYKSHIFQLSQEIFSEENQHSFITPLGNNHKFQGWADIFTNYDKPAIGLKDQYFTYKGRFKKIRWRMVHHHFIGYESGKNIGNELDIELAYRATRKWELKLISANYWTKDGSTRFQRFNTDLTTWFFSVAYNI